MKILVIDDDEGILTMLKVSLTQFGHDVVTAKDGQEGLDLYFDNPNSFQVIIVDIKMPIIDGIEFVRKVLLKDYVTPIILMTGHSNPTDNLNFSYLGLLYKPFDIDNLLELLDEAEELTKK